MYLRNIQSIYSDGYWLEAWPYFCGVASVRPIYSRSGRSFYARYIWWMRIEARQPAARALTRSNSYIVEQVLREMLHDEHPVA